MAIVLLFVAAFIVLLIFAIENDFEWGFLLCENFVENVGNQHEALKKII